MKSPSKQGLLLLILVTSINLSAQEKVRISVGYGFPELLSLGLSYQLPQAQLEVSAGILSEFSQLSGEVICHFAGHSGYTDRKPWYFKTGLMKFREKLECRMTTITMLPLRVGKDLNLSRKMGFTIDFGVACKLNEKVEQRSTGSAWPGTAVYGIFGDSEGNNFPAISPCFTIGYFIKF